MECNYPKMMVNSYRMKSLAVMKGGRTPSTKIITTKIGGYFTKRYSSYLKGGNQRNFLGKVDF